MEPIPLSDEKEQKIKKNKEKIHEHKSNTLQ